MRDQHDDTRGATDERRIGPRDEVADERGVSETLGFALTLGVVIASVGLIYTVGLGALVDVQSNEQINNAERAIEALAENIADIQRGDGPAREGEIRLGGATLSIANDTVVEVHVNGSGGLAYSQRFHPRSMVYSSENGQVSYEMGAVFRRDGEDVLRVARPSYLCSEDVALVSMLTIQPGANSTTSLASSESVLVSARKNRSALLFPSEPNVNSRAADHVTIRIVESPNAAGWAEYFRENGWTVVDDGVYRCSADRAYLRSTVVDIRLLT